jgi:hypothetical protein
LQEAADAVFSSDEQRQLEGSFFLRKCSSVRSPPIAELQAIAGLTKRCVELARSTTDVKIKVMQLCAHQ